MAQVQRAGGGPQGGGGLAEIVELILDKGIVIDAWLSVSLVGLEILSVRARVVVASVDTYLRYADAIAATATAAQPTAATPPPA